jgi:hypothetical protein
MAVWVSTNVTTRGNFMAERERQVLEAARILDLVDYLERKPRQLSRARRPAISSHCSDMGCLDTQELPRPAAL